MLSKFEPNVHAKKLKSYRKRYKMPLRLKPISPVHKKCKHKKALDKTSGEIACVKCGEVCDVWFMNPKEDKGTQENSGNMVIWNRGYDKSRWTTYTLDALQGKINAQLTDQLWLDLLREIPDPFRWYDVYKVFQKYKLLKYWMGFGEVIGMKAKLTKPIIDFFNEHVEMGHGKYCISYMYLLYKFTQMFGEPGDERLIPLKYSASWCKKTDGWWEIMCLENQWDFYATKVYKIPWNKQEVVRKFANYVRDYLKATQKHLKHV